MPLVREHVALRLAITRWGEDVPSVYACYRFATKLRTYGHLLATCIDRVAAALHEKHPEMGANVAIDGSDMPASPTASGTSPRTDRSANASPTPTASWGHRSAVSTRKGGWFYGYKVHAAVCTATGLPLAWSVETARDAEQTFALPLIDAARKRGSMCGRRSWQGL